jgi:hypothetical protein
VNVGGVRERLSGKPRASDPIKLAVLPFENLTGDPEQEYFSDGLTQEMITQLGRLHPQRLRVIARTSSMRYKNRDASLEEIGREFQLAPVWSTNCASRSWLNHPGGTARIAAPARQLIRSAEHLGQHRSLTRANAMAVRFGSEAA